MWVELLATAGRIPGYINSTQQALMRRLYTTPPESYWLGDHLVPAQQIARDRMPA